MIVRLSTALFVSSFVVVAPALAEGTPTSPTVTLDCFVAPVTAQVGEPVVETAPEVHAQAPSPAAAPDLTPAIEISTAEVERTLAPENFLDRHEMETLAMITTDLTSAGDLTTGSLAAAVGEDVPVHLPEHGSDLLGFVLMDDALVFEAGLQP